MFAKLRNLEHKLGNIEIEDIQQLEVDSSDSFYAEILDAFLTKFSHSFKIKDILEEKRELLVLTLIRKLETMTEGLPKPKSTLKFKVLQNICDSIRICLRESMDLKGSQISHLFQALLSIIVNFPHYGRDLSLSAIRCLINVLNKHGGRIESFVQDVNLNACKLLCAVIQNDEATSLTHSSFTDNFAESKSEGAADRTKKGEDKTAVDPLATSASTDKSYRAEDKQASNVYNDERKLSSDSKSDNAVNNDLSLVHYCVKVLYMATCQSEEAQFKLKGDLSIISACIYRLVRCLLNNHCSSTCVNGAGEPAVHKLSNFPYNESNANLFQDLCKLLYILDVYPALETASYAQHNSVYVLPSEQLVGYLVEEYTLYKHLFKDVDVQSIDEISVRISRSGNSLDNSISFTHNGSGSHKWNLTWNPLAGLPALELLNAIILIVLTVSPIYLQLLYNCESDINQNNYYIGKLSECEEASLQLLLLASDSTLQSFFGCNSDSSGKQSNKQVAYTTVLMNIQSLHLRHKYLANSLVRVLNRILLGLHSMNTTEKCAVLTPILIVLSKLISFDSKTLERVKRIIFPSPYSGPPQNTHISAVSNISHALAAPNRTFVGKLYNSGKEGSADAKAAAGNNSLMKKSQSHYVSRSPNLGSGESVKSDDDSHRSVKYTSNIDPRDCPANTLRYELVKLMTSLDTQVKRIVAEFVFTLCHNDVNEFVYRTGFGNSVALLQLKGLM